jgi:hypothetical protein
MLTNKSYLIDARVAGAFAILMQLDAGSAMR